MTLMSKRLSVPELSDRILDMARTGVYRQSILEALAPVAPQKDIRQAIAQAKKWGLYSVASLRDRELGTYYQLDLETYESLRRALSASVLLEGKTDRLQAALEATRTVQIMLKTAQAVAIGLFMLAMTGMVIDGGHANLNLFAGAAGAAGVWGIQRYLVQRRPSQSSPSQSSPSQSS